METPFDRRSCYDCEHCKAVISLWCRSHEASKARGTKIPGVIHCPFWKPDWKYIDKKYHPHELQPKLRIIRSKVKALWSSILRVTKYFIV